MFNPILDDASGHRKTIILSDKITAGVIILIGVYIIYNSINNWHSFHQTRELISALLGFSEPEIVHPIRIMGGLLVCFYGIRLLIEKMKRRMAMLWSFITIIGVNMITIFL